MNIEVVKEEKDRLHREVWRFWLNDEVLKLNEYTRESRTMTRHKYKVDRGYYRLDARRRFNQLKIEEVPLTGEIMEAAKQKVLESLRVDF